MASARITREIPPTTWDARRPRNGKRNPVTLVNTVLVRKVAVQPSSRFAVKNPYTTIRPEAIPIKLIATCTKVNIVSPRLMVSSFECSIQQHLMFQGSASFIGGYLAQLSRCGEPGLGAQSRLRTAHGPRPEPWIAH